MATSRRRELHAVVNSHECPVLDRDHLRDGGLGDITAQSGIARIILIIQRLDDLALLGAPLLRCC